MIPEGHQFNRKGTNGKPVYGPYRPANSTPQPAGDTATPNPPPTESKAQIPAEVGQNVSKDSSLSRGTSPTRRKPSSDDDINGATTV